ncbi:UNVERIFIED_CONTAM: hypothetical protein GTU68_009142 [Idotea baltica]|nr:hypothetical protein [Idotea baltica]
MRIGSCT